MCCCYFFADLPRIGIYLEFLEECMNLIGTIAGLESVFGARWDDSRSGARLKADYGGATGYYDGTDVKAGMYPAPAVISRMLTITDEFAPYAIFYHDDQGEHFGSIVFSAGQIAPLSEVTYDTVADWEVGIQRTIDDGNVDAVYVPVDADFTNDKVVPYEYLDEVETKDLPKISKTSNLGTALIVLAMLLVFLSIPFGAWIFVADPFAEEEREVRMVTETLKPNFASLLDRCGEDLGDPWPAPPEWTLSQEGCVMAPEMTRITFPTPPDQTPYVYRFYELDGQMWDDYLSRASFLKMAERFPGQVMEAQGQFVLYIPYELENEIVDNAYQANSEPAPVVRENFIGVINITSSMGTGTLSGYTDLELEPTLDRLSGKRITPVHVWRDLSSQQTGIEAAPERIETRQVRAR